MFNKMKLLNLFLFFILLSVIAKDAYCQSGYFYESEYKLFQSIEVGYMFSPTTIASYDETIASTKDYKANKGFDIGFGIEYYNVNNFLIFDLNANLSYLFWENDSKKGMFIINISSRLFFQIVSYIRLYGDLGFDLIFSKIPENASGDDIGTGVGLTYGGGIEFLIPSGDSRFVLGFNFRYHEKTDFITLTPYLGIKF